MPIYNKLRLLLLFTLLGAAAADWINIIRLEIANWALAQSVMPPEGVICTEKGHKPKSCHCWEPNGKPSSGQDNDCDGPKGCLMYGSSSEGSFNYTNVSAPELQTWMSGQAIPDGLVTAIKGITAQPSIDYQTVNLTMSDKDKPGHAGAYVASARKDTNNVVWIGVASGTVKGNLITPEKRKDVPSGDCHGTTRGMKERDFTDVQFQRARN